MKNLLSNLLEAHKDKLADKCAIKSAENEYSFKELETQSTNFAAVLKSEFNVQKGDRVLFIAEKSTELILAIIAVWKAGAIFVPVDKDNGMNRTKFMLDDVSPQVVISSKKGLTKFEKAIGNTLTVDYEYIKEVSKKEETMESEVALEEIDTAAIIYTSGSTGNPKGVCLSHESLIKYFRAENELLKFDETCNNINFGPYHFDVSIQDTFLPLFFGAGVYMYDNFLIPELILDLVLEFDVTHLICISSIFTLITGDEDEMKRLNESRLTCCMVGGELIDNKIINYWLKSIDDLTLYYGYGPTECNSLCMAYHIQEIEEDRKRQYPIGKAFNGSKALLIDQSDNVVTENGVVGRLLIGGIQLMKGYWGLPDQTKKAFIYIDNEKYYITGDLAQRDLSGNYIFEGRNDSEIKLHGRRINLNEIRDAVLKVPGVQYSVIDVVKIKEEREIYGYIYMTNKEEGLTKEIAIAHLREHLPEYMIPKHLFITDVIFKTSSNKINERRIREYVNETYFTSVA